MKDRRKEMKYTITTSYQNGIDAAPQPYLTVYLGDNRSWDLTETELQHWRDVLDNAAKALHSWKPSSP